MRRHETRSRSGKRHVLWHVHLPARIHQPPRHTHTHTLAISITLFNTQARMRFPWKQNPGPSLTSRSPGKNQRRPRQRCQDDNLFDRKAILLLKAPTLYFRDASRRAPSDESRSMVRVVNPDVCLSHAFRTVTVTWTGSRRKAPMRTFEPSGCPPCLSVLLSAGFVLMP